MISSAKEEQDHDNNNKQKKLRHPGREDSLFKPS